MDIQQFKGILGRIFSLVLSLVVGIGIWSIDVPEVFAIDYNQEYLVDSDFSNQVLQDASFRHANLRNSDFSHCDLRGVSFFASNLERANFEGADLSYADLSSARLTYANLTDAILEGAFLINTKVDGATIKGADFTDALLSLNIEQTLCKMAQGTNPITKEATKDTLFCY